MKKVVLSLLLVLMLVLSVFSLTGCGEKKEEEKKAKGLVGSWAHTSGYTYTFNEDKTGQYALGEGAMKFTYEDDGTKLSILYEGKTEPFETTYKIDGDKLTIKDSFDNDIVYNRK